MTNEGKYQIRFKLSSALVMLESAEKVLSDQYISSEWATPLEQLAKVQLAGARIAILEAQKAVNSVEVKP